MSKHERQLVTLRGQPAAVLSQAFQVEDIDAVTVSLAISKAKKQLNNVQKKEVDKLQTLRHYLDKIDDDKYQGVELPNLETAMTNLKEHAPSFVQLLQNAIEIRLSGSNDIATMADILNCEAWDCKAAETSPWIKSFWVTFATFNNLSESKDSRHHKSK